MALFDRMREYGPANTIAASCPEDLHSASAGQRNAAAADPAAYIAEPEAIARRYYVEERGDERRYYDDYQRKSLAIRADSSTITSRREDLNTVRAMLTLAEARGWSEVNLTGSTAFRREAWIEAAAAGIVARGYHASDLDRQEADRRRAERGRGGNQVRQGAVPSPAQPPPTAADDRRAAIAAEAELSADARLVLAALSEKIDRQMHKLNRDAKAELRAFAASELARKERVEGPIVLSAEHRRAATASEPTRAPRPTPVRPREEMEAPRRSLAR